MTELTAEPLTFAEMLPEALKESPALKGVKDVADLATQFVNQQSLIGNSVRIPTEDSGTDQVNAFYAKLADVPGVVRLPGDEADAETQRAFLDKTGVPRTAAEYKLNAPEGVTLDAQYTQRLTENGIALNWSNDQINKVLTMELEGQQTADEAATVYATQSQAALKAIWGADYDVRAAGAKNAYRILTEEMPEHADGLAQVATNPIIVKMLSDINETLQEKGHVGTQGSPNYGMTVGDAKAKKEEIMGNREHLYHKGGKEAIAYMRTLNQTIIGVTE